jgi:hypothetical protein
MKGLIGRTEIGDALKRLDKLTQEEARMAAAQNLKVTHGVADAVVAVVQRMADEVKRLSSPNLISASLTHSFTFREPITGEHAQLALPSGPIDELQHGMWHSSQENGTVVFSRQHLSRVEVDRIASLDSRKTFVISSCQLDSL